MGGVYKKFINQITYKTNCSSKVYEKSVDASKTKKTNLENFWWTIGIN